MSETTVFDKLDTSDMHGRSKRGMAVTLSAQGARFGLQTCSTIALGRLLSPSDFGLIAMVAVVTNFIAMFKDAGLAQATVQREQITNEQISTLFWLNLAISGLLGLLVIACSPLVAWIFDDSRLILLTIALSLPIFLSGFGLQHRALLQRNLRFWEISRSEILGLATGVVVGVCCAFWGLGYWSLVWMQVTTVLATTIIVLNLVRWCPLRPSRGTGVRDMLKFGANLTGFQLVNYFARNSDNFLIGKFVGGGALGQYSVAYRFLMVPISQLNAPIVSVLTPAMARLSHDHEQRNELYLKYVAIVAWLTVIPISLLVIWGQELVVLLLGAEWNSAGELFEILAIASIFQPISNLTGVLFISSGNTNKLFRWGIFSSIFTVIGFSVGVLFGVRGVAIAYASTSLILTLPCWWWACRSCRVPFLQGFLRCVSIPCFFPVLILVLAFEFGLT